MSSNSIPNARSSDVLVFNFESRSWECSRTDRFETLNFGSLMLLSFSAISSQTLLSRLSEVCSWTARSTRSLGIKLHRVFRTTPWCLTCMTTNFYPSERSNLLNKLQLSNTNQVPLFSTHWNNKKQKNGHGGNFALRASENVVNFFSLEVEQQNENCLCDLKSIAKICFRNYVF